MCATHKLEKPMGKRRIKTRTAQKLNKTFLFLQFKKRAAGKPTAAATTAAKVLPTKGKVNPAKVTVYKRSCEIYNK